MEMNLDTIYFDYIRSGKKLYEIRIYDDKRKKIKLLDIITFRDRETKKTFSAKIIELSYFPDFKSAISEVGIKKVLPNARSLKEGIDTYLNFPQYKEGSKKNGVLRMRFQLIK